MGQMTLLVLFIVLSEIIFMSASTKTTHDITTVRVKYKKDINMNI